MLPAVLLLAALAAGCSSASDPTLPSFSDVSAAPPPIQAAAEAVVKIHTVGEAATGAFVSSTGLLLTNNHVLGVDVCPADGCYVLLTLRHQRGAPPQDPISVFAMPVAVSPGLDVALVQIYAGPGLPMLQTPHFLSIEPIDVASLQGKHVHVVGHPEGHLKKWTSGTVVDASGEDWFETTAYVLPGSSGSPVLDDQGKLVGLVHRSPQGEDRITLKGYDVASVATASLPLQAALKAPLPPQMISTTASVSRAGVVEHNRLYLNAGAGSVRLIGEPQQTVLSVLGEACDRGLARTDFRSPEDLSAALAPCMDAMLWIMCRPDPQRMALGTECPSRDEQAAWAQRFRAVTQTWLSFNGELVLSPLSTGIDELSSDLGDAGSNSMQEIQRVLSSANPPLDFALASLLASKGATSYNGVDLSAYVENYAKIPSYYLSAPAIVAAALWLNHANEMDRETVLQIMRGLLADGDVTVGARLSIEDALYLRGVLD